MAMQNYMQGQNYFCSIHLAGAAEELLAKYLPKEKQGFEFAWKAQRALQAEATQSGPSHESEKYLAESAKQDRLTKKDRAAMNFVNADKNAVKHMSPNAPTITIDPAPSALWQIEQALKNFYKLKQGKSAMLWRFEDFRNVEMQRLKGSSSI